MLKKNVVLIQTFKNIFICIQRMIFYVSLEK